jgi:hypothetical protein
MNGQYGPYIRYNNKSNHKIVLDKSMTEEEKIKYLEKLTVTECNKIMSSAKDKKKPKKKEPK